MAEDRVVEQRAAPLLGEPRPAQYPDSDGLPMAENDEHWEAIMSIRTPLQQLFRGCADTYVTGDLLLYYRKNDRRRSVAPDVMVVKGVDPGPRRSYVLWEEGRPPDFVVEVHSLDSREYDRGDKRELYASLGVREYFVFDPLYEEKGRAGDLRGYRLWGGRLVESEARGELRSEELELSLRAEGKRVRVRDLRTGQDLPWFDEEAAAREAAERRRDEEAELRRAAEARIANLEALLQDAKALLRKPVGE